MSDTVVAIAFRRTSTLDATVQIVDASCSLHAIAQGVAAGTLCITHAPGHGRWGCICLRDNPDHLIAEIIEAQEDAGGAAYDDLAVDE